ncbi:dymeclin [Punica granatum]|uniref:Dymeclin n=2 Tax=Punica granatum TaxID=22663 RepID=A0A6P8DJX3_PUNGR|nr:dymeclin [Punica granatum]
MGAVPSTPRYGGSTQQDTAEYLIGTLVGEKSFPLGSDFWQKLLELPQDLRWPPDRVNQACELFAQNNGSTRHLSKILIHLSWCLQESMSTSGASPSLTLKILNALFISSVFLKHLIENTKSDCIQDLYLFLDETEPTPDHFTGGQSIENLVMQSVLSFIGSVDTSPNTYILHQELLNFMQIAMSTQLLSGPSPRPKDVNPFLDAAMAQESSLVCLVVRRLLENYLLRPTTSFGGVSYSTLSDGGPPGVLQRVGSAAANILLLPFNYLVSPKEEGSRSMLAECSLLVLLVLIHYCKCVLREEAMTEKSDDTATSDSLLKETTYLCDNPYCKALENARDIEFDRVVDVEGNACHGPLVKLPFASLFDTLGMCLTDEAAVLLLYSLVQGNSAFLEYVLVRTDIDTLLVPILETLYNASKRSSNHIYMLLIILLILSQDSSFNASVHKLTLPSVPWYQERRLHQTSLGSLLVIILIRTVKYNLSKLRDVYLHTNCLATLANMAPHCHRLSAYASERLVSLFDMLSKKYNKLAELRDKKTHINRGNSLEEDSLVEDMSTEFYIYTDFLRIVLEILNEILTYALPRNPEVVYAIMHRQEVFQPFKNHPRFNELLENIYTVLDFFNSRMDAQRVDGEWSVDKVLEVIIINCRSWRGEGMKMFTQLRFTYEQESQSEEFFIPYIWQLILAHCGFSFNPDAINLFPPNISAENQESNAEADKHGNGDVKVNGIFLDP